MKYKIKSMRLKNRPTKIKTEEHLLPTCSGWLPIPGGAIGSIENKYDGFSDMYIGFYPEDESLPVVPLVTITHNAYMHDNDNIQMYVDDGTGNYTKYCGNWSIKELTKYAEEI